MAGTGLLWASKQLMLMFGIGLTILVVIGLLKWGPLNDGKAGCTFYGDTLAIGTTVYVDDKWQGVLMRAAGANNMSKLERRVTRGPRSVLFVNQAGDSVRGAFESKAEATVWVSFADTSVSQGP